MWGDHCRENMIRIQIGRHLQGQFFMGRLHNIVTIFYLTKKKKKTFWYVLPPSTQAYMLHHKGMMYYFLLSLLSVLFCVDKNILPPCHFVNIWLVEPPPLSYKILTRAFCNRAMHKTKYYILNDTVEKKHKTQAQHKHHCDFTFPLLPFTHPKPCFFPKQYLISSFPHCDNTTLHRSYTHDGGDLPLAIPNGINFKS